LISDHPTPGTRTADHTLGHAAGLMPAERDRVRAFNVDYELAIEDEKELILVFVLMPMKVALDLPFRTSRSLFLPPSLGVVGEFE
jgi:hypothetical protein